MRGNLVLSAQGRLGKGWNGGEEGQGQAAEFFFTDIALA
jgi:hypothetical protein